MTIAELRTKHTAVLLGYGKEGRATEQFLRTFVPHLEIIIADANTDPKYLDRQFDGDLVIKTPGLPGSMLSVPYTTSTNLFLANVPCPVIAVTGSKGKSTTSSLIAALLRAHGNTVHLVGNIGEPSIALLLQPLAPTDLVILEVSSYQAADLDRAPQIVVYTSFFPEHLDYHGSLAAYADAKAHLTLLQTPEDVFFYNPSYEELRRIALQTSAQAIPFIQTLPFALPPLHLRGEHNLANIRGAWTVAQAFGVTPTEAQRALAAFQPLPHRLNIVGIYRGITFIDDAIATTPEATIEAIRCFPETQTIFLGGKDRGLSYEALADVMATSDIENIALFPETGGAIRETLERRSPGRYRFFPTASMQDAVQWAYETTDPERVCLLSCASPSYSLWKNFEDKGDQFIAAVKQFGV